MADLYILEQDLVSSSWSFQKKKKNENLLEAFVGCMKTGFRLSLSKIFCHLSFRLPLVGKTSQPNL